MTTNLLERWAFWHDRLEADINGALADMMDPGAIRDLVDELIREYTANE